MVAVEDRTPGSQVDRNPSIAQLRLGEYVFKRAESPAELDQVYRLNYRTFVGEIGQHSDPGTDRLVDKFDDKNVYLIALEGERVVGMLAVHDRPPFSIATRLADPALLERLGERLLEVRLLAIEKEYRSTLVFAGLIWIVYEYARSGGYTHIVGSGVVDRLSIYQRLGMRPLGPPVPDGNAAFVPLAASLEELLRVNEHNVMRWQHRLARTTRRPPQRTVCLLPGPVSLSDHVRDAMSAAPESHRGREFVDRFEYVRRRLEALVNTTHVAILCGSGTLANDALAATLAADRQTREGLVLVNGEFGERLVRQAERFGLSFHVLRWPWGRPWDLDQVSDTLDRRPAVDWIWGVHLETSTGVLNDLAGLEQRLKNRGVRLCLDCVSSAGAVPLDLSRIWLATASSGKSLAGVAGLAIVFAARDALTGVNTQPVPTYLDVVAAVESVGPRFTCGSGVLLALDRALELYTTEADRRRRFEHYEQLGRYVRTRLRSIGLEPLVAEAFAAPIITTFTPPLGIPADAFLRQCRQWGYELSGHSSYLSQRGWVQIATMGHLTADDCEPLFEHLARWLGHRPHCGFHASAVAR
jgi:aspartate aminotransferase-like enzyme/N-acyl-L-homoserine lactone synthetase